MIIPFYGISQSRKYKRAIRFFERLIALYFYNNSNYVAILLPRSIYNRQKSSIFKAFWPFGDHSHSTKPNQFCLEIILCRIRGAFDYLMYPYYPAYMG